MLTFLMEALWSFNLIHIPTPSHGEDSLAICSHQDDSTFYLWHYVCSGDLQTKKKLCLVQVRLGTEVLRTPSSTQPVFELMTSRP